MGDGKSYLEAAHPAVRGLDHHGPETLGDCAVDLDCDAMYEAIRRPEAGL